MTEGNTGWPITNRMPDPFPVKPGRVRRALGSLNSKRPNVTRRTSARPENSPAVVIVSSRQRLWQRHGAEGVFAIERAVGDLVEGMALRGLSGTLVYLDDSPMLSKLGVLPADTGQSDSVGRVVRDLEHRLQWFDEDAQYLLILGGDDVIPFHRAENPSPDGESSLFSDFAYATTAAEPLRPVRAVGRIPDTSLPAFLDAIHNAADAHRRLAARKGPPLAQAAFGYSASVWKRAARSVYASIGDPTQLRLSPPLSVSELPPEGDQSPRFRYYNLHGLPDSECWFGQRDPSLAADYPFFPVALRPENVPHAPGALVFSEACFGADISGRGVDDSVALTTLARGALGFVGATGVAYAGLDGPLVGADLLAHGFWEGILMGLPAGAALGAAKWRLVREAVRRQGYVDAEDEKAVLNFVLYGDPSLVHCAPSVWAEDAAAAPAPDAVEWAGPAESVGTVPVQPVIHRAASQTHAEEAPDALIEMVQKTVSRRLPEFADSGVHVSAARPLDGTFAKSTMSDGQAPANAYVITLSKALPACEGLCYREFVRVTVDCAGRIHKMSVSR